MAEHDVDVLIVGGGQCGVPLAWSLAQAGRRVALAERARLGGSCVNFGCTPTKAALASAQIAHQARRAREFGVVIPTVDVDFPAVLARARAIAAESRTGIEKGFAGSANPFLLPGHARVTGRSASGFELDVGGAVVRAREVVLNTGTRSRRPDIPGLDGLDPLHAGNWLDRPDRPAHVVMLGGGVIALEMGQFYRRMGCAVTIIERADHVAGREDPDVADALQRALAGEGIAFAMKAAIERVEAAPAGVRVHVTDGGGRRAIEGSHLFIALGREPNTRDLGLESIGLGLDAQGLVPVDERLATTVPGVWAAGDIRGGPQFTHTSWDDFRILRSQMAGDRSRTTRRIVPYGIFTDPEVGRVGLSETEAQRQAVPHEVLRFDLARNGRAREMGASEGFIKVLVEPGSRRILGAAVLAAQGSELVHLYVDLMNAGASADVIRDAVHAHPTLAEAIQSAVT